jgi:predicted RNA binding protein YcfA (HicA-like mRNA interferase family)
VKVRDLVRLLESNGWQHKTTKGIHRQFRHPTKGMVVTVSGQLGRDNPDRYFEGDFAKRQS